MNTARLGVYWVCILILAVGCARSEKKVKAKDASRLERRLVNSVVDEQVAQGIIRQRAIYPYHFVPGTDELNELGMRDLTVLADYFSKHPGRLSVRPDQEAADLNEARMRAVHDFLALHGVQVSRIDFNHNWPAGDGSAAETAALQSAASRASGADKGNGSGMAIPLFVGVNGGGKR